jgi:hypothetical protein
MQLRTNVPYILFLLPSSPARQAYKGGAFKKGSKSYPIKIVAFLKMKYFLLTG